MDFQGGTLKLWVASWHVQRSIRITEEKINARAATTISMRAGNDVRTTHSWPPASRETSAFSSVASLDTYLDRVSDPTIDCEHRVYLTASHEAARQEHVDLIETDKEPLWAGIAYR